MLAFCTRNTRVLLVVLILGFILLVVTHRKDESPLGDSKLTGWTDRLRGHSSQPQTSGNNIESDNQPHGSTLFDTELRWDDMPVPATKIIAHAPGWTIFDRLYVLEGAIIVVTDSPELIPNPKEITSKGQSIQAHNANLKQLEPTEKEFKVISTEEAKLLFGPSSIRISGISFLSSESPQFLSHMYHFVAELLFGMWRIYSTLDQGIEINGHTLLPAPRRWIFPHIGMTEWRDYAAMNEYVVRAAFPSMTLEFSDAWEERAGIKGRVFSYDRVVVGDRVAAMHEEDYSITERIAAGAFKLRSSPSWWNTIRMAVLEYSKVRKRDIMHDVPVITYVSRQNWGRRMLREKDHLQLVAALEALRDRRGLEIQIVELDRMSRAEQILVAARSTILIGLHGNGLSTLLWMRPQLQSTVIEFFYPGGFARDYEWTATALSMGYYGVWDKHIFSAPNLPQHALPEGFHGNQIPLDAETVIQLIEHRLDRPGMIWD